MDEAAIFAKRMKEAREKKGLKQKELAEKIGVTPQTISAYEKTGKAPTMDNAISIAKILDVSLDWLCGINQDVKKQNGTTTLGDAARFLHEMSSWITVSVYDDCISSSNNYRPVCPGVIFDLDDELANFISDSLKMKKLLKDGTFTKEFYDRWVADRFRSLDGITIESYLDSHALPF